MEKETSEVSTASNWVHPVLRQNGFDIFDIEGYSLDEDTGTIELLIDRRKVNDVRAYNQGRAWREFEETIDENELEAKTALASHAGCDYAVALYDDERVQVYTFDPIDEVTDVLSFAEFGAWVFGHNSTEELSKDFIHDENFPSLDAALRANDTPWPPNLDGFWYDEDGVQCLIEYQTTNLAKVANHSNNRYFSSDIGRWKHLYGMAEALDLPLIIIVWSPNKDDDDVKLKRVHEVNFSGQQRGLSYGSVELIQEKEVADELRGMA